MLLELLESAQSPELLEWIQSKPIILDSFLQNHKVHCAFYQNMNSMVMTETSVCVCVCVYPAYFTNLKVPGDTKRKDVLLNSPLILHR